MKFRVIIQLVFGIGNEQKKQNEVTLTFRQSAAIVGLTVETVCIGHVTTNTSSPWCRANTSTVTIISTEGP